MFKYVLAIVLVVSATGEIPEDDLLTPIETIGTPASAAAEAAAEILVKPEAKENVLPSAPNGTVNVVADKYDPFPDLKSSQLCAVCDCLYPNVINCTKLSLTENLSDEHWPRVSLLTDYTIDYSYNLFEKVRPFRKMPITRLLLSACGIQTIEPKAFDELTSLEDLDLSNNYLSLFSDNIFQRKYLPIKKLYLEGNQIGYIQEKAFDKIPDLERLVLDRNPLGTWDMSTSTAVRKLEKLQILRLFKTQLIDIPPGSFANLAQMTTLDLSSNQLITFPTALRNVTKLKYLNIDKNLISRLDDQSFIGLKYLERLEMSSSSQLKHIGADTFSPLKSLKFFHCSFNPQLKSIHPDAFRGMKNKRDFSLSEFYFQGNGVSSIPPELLSWDQVNEINIRDNPFICDSSIDAMIISLIPSIEKTPRLVSNLTCWGPAAHKGKSLMDFFQDENNLMSMDYLQDEDRFSETIFESLNLSPSNFKAGVLVVSLIGIFLIIGIVAYTGLKKDGRNPMGLVVLPEAIQEIPLLPLSQQRQGLAAQGEEPLITE